MTGEIPKVMNMDIAIFGVSFWAPRLKQCLSEDTKYVVLMREPVSRAYSLWRMYTDPRAHRPGFWGETRDFATACADQHRKWTKGGEFQKLFQECLQAESIEPANYLLDKMHDSEEDFCHYFDFMMPYFYGCEADHLRRWVNTMGRENVLISNNVCFTSAVTKPQVLANEICNFIGVSPLPVDELPQTNMSLSHKKLKPHEILDLLDPKLRRDMTELCTKLNTQLVEYGMTSAAEWNNRYKHRQTDACI